MQDELKSKLVEILTSIQTAAGKASDFALAQLPDIAQSYVVYGRSLATAVEVGLLFLLAVAVFIALRYGYLNTTAVHTKQYYEGRWMEHRVTACVFGTGASLFLTGGVFASLPEFLMVWFAPKVWLLREIAHLLK